MLAFSIIGASVSRSLRAKSAKAWPERPENSTVKVLRRLRTSGSWPTAFSSAVKVVDNDLWHDAIPYCDAVEILRTMCDGRVLDKVRHVVTHAGAVWHVDVYEGILNGIVLAE